MAQSWPWVSQIAVKKKQKTNKYEYLTGEEILPSDQSRIIGQDKFTYSLLGKVKKQTKAIEDQGKIMLSFKR